MRSLLRIVACLYPPAWRKRYGRELEALIEDARPGLGGAFDLLKGALVMQLKSFSPLTAVVVCALGGLGLTFYLTPVRWSSTAVVTMSKDLANPVNAVQSRLNDGALDEIVGDHGLFPGAGDRRDITVTPLADQDTPAFRIEFLDTDPDRAQKVVQEITRRYTADPEEFKLIELATRAEPHRTLRSSGILKGLSHGPIIGGPIAAFLYWRRRRSQK
jgi:hypothetical protein